MPEVTVIVPIYNVEKYLSECLESIINQTFLDIDIICVNDASTDNSATILAKYAKIDSRFQIINHKVNSGLGAARNTGVEASKSKYIAFVDSDDSIAPNFLEVLYNLLISTNTHMSWCGTNNIKEDGTFLHAYPVPEKIWTVAEVLDTKELYPSVLPVWNKLFLRDKFEKIKQLPIVSEDQPAIAEYFTLIESISTTSQTLYNYRQRDNTLSNPKKLKPDLWNDFFKSHTLFFEILRKKYSQKSLRKQAILRHYSLLWRIQKFKLLDTRDWVEHERKIIKHLKEDSIGLKKQSSVFYWSLRFLFINRLSIKSKTICLQILLKLSLKRWLYRANWMVFPLDFFWVIIPNIKFFLHSFFDFLELNAIKFLARIHKFIFPKPLWLIGERPDTAQDNGNAFYNYLQSNQPGIKSYYIIDKHSNQYKELPENKRYLHYNSLKQKIFFLRCKYYVSSHNHYCIPLCIAGRKRYKFPKTTKNIFLQHGITFNDNSDIYGKENSSIDLFICGAKPEYDFIITKFGYSEDEIKYTGFARFDNLHKFSTQRTILLMPTWRKSIWENRLLKNDNFFLNSCYYATFQSLINNKNLLEILNTNDYKLIFYPHYEIQPYLHYFSSCSDRLILASENEHNIQDLLKTSQLLVTDNSSISFDFAYMHKPLIYYFFDREDFETNHLKPGYFDHYKMGFGEVVEQEEQLIGQINSYIENDCSMKPLYRKRIEDFFQLYDDNNCERIFKSIERTR